MLKLPIKQKVSNKKERNFRKNKASVPLAKCKINYPFSSPPLGYVCFNPSQPLTRDRTVVGEGNSGHHGGFSLIMTCLTYLYTLLQESCKTEGEGRPHSPRSTDAALWKMLGRHLGVGRLRGRLAGEGGRRGRGSSVKVPAGGETPAAPRQTWWWGRTGRLTGAALGWTWAGPAGSGCR